MHCILTLRLLMSYIYIYDISSLRVKACDPQEIGKISAKLTAYN